VPYCSAFVRDAVTLIEGLLGARHTDDPMRKVFALSALAADRQRDQAGVGGVLGPIGPLHGEALRALLTVLNALLAYFDEKQYRCVRLCVRMCVLKCMCVCVLSSCSCMYVFVCVCACACMYMHLLKMLTHLALMSVLGSFRSGDGQSVVTNLVVYSDMSLVSLPLCLSL
jgi:hypothetical protein